MQYVIHTLFHHTAHSSQFICTWSIYGLALLMMSSCRIGSLLSTTLCTCMYICTILQTVSTPFSNRCIMIWYDTILWNWSYTNTVLYSTQCCSEIKEILFTELALNAICSRKNNASCKWHTVHLTVTITLIVHSMPVTDVWFKILWL